MSAPEIIWVYPTEKEPTASWDRRNAPWVKGVFTTYDTSGEHTGPSEKEVYRRADLLPTFTVDAEVRAHPKVKALVEAANDICLIAERDEWHKAMTGRQIILRNLRAALAAIQEAKP